MISLKKEIYAHLQGLEAKVVQGQPKSWKTLPIITFEEASNQAHILIGQKEYYSEHIYLIHLWSDKSTTQLSLDTDTCMKQIGFKRIFSHTLIDPSGLNHTLLRYRALVHNTHLSVNQ